MLSNKLLLAKASGSSGGPVQYIDKTSTTASGTSVSISIPPNALVGDYLVLFVVGAAHTIGNTLTFTRPNTSWTIVNNGTITSVDRYYATYTKTYVAGDSNPFSVTASVTATISAGCIAVRNGSGLVNSSISATLSQEYTAPSLTIASNNSLAALIGYAVRSSSAADLTWTFPSPYTEVIDQSNTAASRSAYLGVAYNSTLQNAGTLPTSSVFSTSANSSGVGGYLIFGP